ncbi:MAG: hypothetical protein H6561_21200 [Lewinellaceae bacterium]|nr:hypothetical protein [Lewinellaceae bacterium]
MNILRHTTIFLFLAFCAQPVLAHRPDIGTGKVAPSSEVLELREDYAPSVQH